VHAPPDRRRRPGRQWGEDSPDSTAPRRWRERERERERERDQRHGLLHAFVLDVAGERGGPDRTSSGVESPAATSHISKIRCRAREREPGPSREGVMSPIRRGKLGFGAASSDSAAARSDLVLR
jgi:hypothetical protein